MSYPAIISEFLSVLLTPGDSVRDPGADRNPGLHLHGTPPRTRALARDPYNGAYLDSLGWVYFKMGKLDLAEENLLKAIGSLRLTGVVYDHLGDLYFRKGDREQAVEFWKKALDQDDDELEKNEVAQKIERATTTP